MLNSYRLNDTIRQQVLVSIHLVFGLFGIMVLAGVPYAESIRISVVIGTQVLSGVFLFSIISDKEHYDLPLVLGAGITIGTASTTFIHLFFRESSLSVFAWLIPLCFSLFITAQKIFYRHPTGSSEKRTSPNIYHFAVGLILTTIGLADQWWWLYPIIIHLSALTFCIYSVKTSAHRRTRCLLLMISGLFLTSFPMVILWVVSLRKINYLWWIISYDIPFLESIAYSINQWGPNENVSAPGTAISYHWFSLAWSGMTSEISSAKSWTLITIAAPIVICLGIACLIYSITFFFTKSQPFSLAASISTMLVREVVSVTSLSQLYSFLPLLLIVRLTLELFQSRRVSKQLSLIVLFLVFCLYGSKVSSGATLVMGLILFLIFSRSIRFRLKVTSVVLLTLITILSYLYFFGNSVRPATLEIGFSDIGGRLVVGMPLQDGRSRYLFEVLTQSFYFLAISFGLVFFITKNQRKVFTFETPLLAFISISGFLLSRFLDGGGTESYFMHATFATGIVLTIVVVHHNLGEVCNRGTYLILFLLVSFGASSGIVRSFLSKQVAKADDYSVFGRMFPYIIIYVFLLISAFILFFLLQRYFHSLNLFLLLLCLLMCSSFIGDQIYRRYSFAFNAHAFESSEHAEFKSWNHFAGDPDQTASLDWIARNVPEDDIIATNRRCLSTVFCGPTKWMLVSALSRHRVLIEGNNTGFPDYTPWLDERIILSQRFISTPNLHDANRLIQLGVRYHYVELSYVNRDYAGSLGFRSLEEASELDWSPFAEIVYQNRTTLVLRLLNSVVSSKS